MLCKLRLNLALEMPFTRLARGHPTSAGLAILPSMHGPMAQIFIILMCNCVVSNLRKEYAKAERDKYC